MATYKYEAEMRFGKYFGHLREAGQPKPDLTKGEGYADIEELVEALQEKIDEKDLSGEDDSIIFRNIAYDDFEQLLDTVRFATF